MRTGTKYLLKIFDNPVNKRDEVNIFCLNLVNN